MEGWTVFLDGLKENPYQVFLLVFLILDLFIVNLAGVIVIKHINALARAIGNAVKGVLVWILSLSVTVAFGGEYPNLRWEKISFMLFLLQGLGFLSMIFGNLIYTNILKIEFLK